ncbi:MAG: oligosaccharide flippase family protein [Nitrospira defluvii]|nr:oligosaccharide flippase family protein [Nitrospira defluvii]
MSIPILQSGMKALLRQTALVFAGKMTAACLGFAMSLVVARLMGPDAFGLFSLFIVILILGNDLLGDGLNPGVVRYYAMHSVTNPIRASEVLTNALALRLLLGIPVVLLGVILGGQIAERLFQNPAYVLPIMLGLVGSLGAALWSFDLAAWQSRQDFVAYALMVGLVNLLRVLSLPILILMGHLTLGAVMGLHVAFFYMCTLAGLWLLRRHLATFQFNGTLLRELFRFSKWPAMASTCFLLQVNLGVPVLNYFYSSREAGVYAAGTSLLQGIDFLTISLLTTLLPKVSQLTSLEQCRAYVQRSFPMYLGLAVCLVPVMFLARPLVIGLFGPAYEGTIPVFQILFLGALGTLVTHPLYLVLYTINRPQLYTYSGIVALAGWILAGLWLIPEYGAVGAAWTTLFARLVQSVMIIVILWYALGFSGSTDVATRSMMPNVRES